MHAQLVVSAASDNQFPHTGLPEVALVGRSNVGKSSLINALTKQKIARTSAAPGKTRLANFYHLSLIPNRKSLIPRSKSPIPEFYMVDLPGYGYARGGPDSVETFEKLTREYFDPARHTRIAGVLHLIDARHPDLPQDAAAFEWLMRTRLPLAIVATKMDKLRQSDQSRTLKMLERSFGVRVLPESAIKGTGVDKVWKLLQGWVAGADV